MKKRVNEALILDFIRENPGCTAEDIMKFCEYSRSGAQHVVERLMRDGLIECAKEGNRCSYTAKERGEYQPPVRYSNVPSEKPSLADYTPRELMQELKQRGYTGKLKLVRIQEVDFNRL